MAASNDKPFQLSAKGLVRNEHGQLLVIRRSASSGSGAGLWDLPGGKLDIGETLDEPLKREIAEETGLAIHLDNVVGAVQMELAERVVVHVIVACRLTSGEVRLSEEHDSFMWVSASQCAELRFQGNITEFLRSHLS